MKAIKLFLLKGMLFWIAVFAFVCGMIWWLQLPHLPLGPRDLKMATVISSFYTLCYFPIFWHWTRK